MIFLSLAAILFVAAFLARRWQARKLDQTRVSNIAGSDYHEPSPARWIALALPPSAFVLIALLVGLDTPSIVAMLLVVLTVFAQVLLARAQVAAGRKTMDARLFRAAQSPEISGAKIGFHFTAPDLRTPDHVTMWQPHLDGLGISWFVILREARQLSHFRVQGMPPALLIKQKSDLRLCVPASLRTVFYANNGQLNREMIAALPSVPHVQLLHGDSDKPPSYSPLTRNYDLVFVAGQVAIDRYKTHGVEIAPERFRIVGRPQVSEIVPRDRTGDIAQVVYMPTWRGHFEDTQFSSLDRAAQVIERIRAVLPDAQITFKPHPMSYKDPDWKSFEFAIRRALGNNGAFAAADQTPFSLYNMADLMITDISSVMIDYLYSGKPLMVVDPPQLAEDQLWEFPTLAAAYRIQADLSDLETQLLKAAGDEPLAESRLKMRAACFGDWGQPVGEAFRAACLDLLQVNTASKSRKTST